jgi:predicted MPP superfamily phosphohydrolase
LLLKSNYNKHTNEYRFTNHSSQYRAGLVTAKSNQEKQLVSTTLRSRLNIALRSRSQRTISAFMDRLGRNRFNAADFEIVPLEVIIPQLDPAFAGYRIVHISDIHIGHWVTAERLAGAVQLVNAQEPDLVAITGDFVSYVLDDVAEGLVPGLSQLRSQDGTVAVLGNHDHWLDAGTVRGLLQRSGVFTLDNDLYVVRRGDAVLQIAGVDDVIVGEERLDRVLEKLPQTGATILLCHEPDFADVSAVSGRIALQLSGHSHGSQVVLPWRGALFRGHYFRKYPIGRYNINGMTLYTNRGLGTHTLRVRLNCPPEITVITLHPG